MPAALISVFDKTGVISFARGLHEIGFKIISSGGTAKILKENKIPVQEVSEYTGFPEMMEGRGKTLHPKIHGGILFKRGNKEHEEQAKTHGIEPIDLVVVNLYPFEQTVAKKGVSFEEIIENIDIGGPALVRAASKNFESVGIITDANDYNGVLNELKEKKKLSMETRSRLARKAFELTASYDASIASFFAKQFEGGVFPEKLVLSWEKAVELRYGENPHQRAAAYRVAGEKTFADLLAHGGKELSYNNILDCDSAWGLAQEFGGEKHACIIVKHNSPCGVALGETQLEAWQKAFASDSISAFGGIVAFNHPLEQKTAEEMKEVFLEVVLAPGFKQGEKAFETLSEKKNLRIVNTEALVGKEKRFEGRTVLNGLLWQTSDNVLLQEFGTVTKRKPTDAEKRDLNFAWIVAKHVKSNAIVLAKNLQTVGIGGGQPNRVDCVDIAGERAKKFGFTTEGSVMASDAFFPFKDSVVKAFELGVDAIIQPGGSLRDSESIEECDRHGIAMVFTKTRHFGH